VTFKKLLWTFTLGLAATALYLVIRESTSTCRDSEPVGFVGNETSAVFHRLECRVFQADEMSPVFVTRQQALDAGYRPCGVCRP
jgi:hypothetical protein